MFLYINKTCFNGIWRVNRKGEFNVPYGYKDKPALPNYLELNRISNLLNTATLKSGDYKMILQDVDKNDFIYLDPPYPPLSKTSNFTHYTSNRFSLNDHLELSDLVKDLDTKGCLFLISNARTDYIKSLYSNFNTYELDVTRWIRADGKRYKVKELIICNYSTT